MNAVTDMSGAIPNGTRGLDDQDHIEITDQEIASIKHVAGSLPWSWEVSKSIDRQGGYVWAQIERHRDADDMSWLPEFSWVMRTGTGYWLSIQLELVGGGYEDDDVGPYPTALDAFAEFPKYLSRKLASWGLKHIAEDLPEAA